MIRKDSIKTKLKKIFTWVGVVIFVTVLTIQSIQIHNLKVELVAEQNRVEFSDIQSSLDDIRTVVTSHHKELIQIIEELDIHDKVLVAHDNILSNHAEVLRCHDSALKVLLESDSKHKF